MFQRYRLEHYTVTSNWLALGILFLFGLLSFSRSVALFRGKCTKNALTQTREALHLGFCLVCDCLTQFRLTWEEGFSIGRTCGFNIKPGI